jgi:glycerol-3-phosphate acyltransferase PlsY
LPDTSHYALRPRPAVTLLGEVNRSNNLFSQEVKMLAVLPIILIVVGYLFGAIPVGYLIGRLYGVNLLESGSGRTGGTNVLRNVGLPAAALTILGDAFKGLIPAYIAANLLPGQPWLAGLVGVATVIGHNYSIFLKFRGGAGGVTALGALAGLSFWAALIACTVAIGAVVLTRYASVGTFSGGVAGLIMLFVIALFGWGPWGYILFGLLVVPLIAWGLRPNFAALRAGTERKIGASGNQIKTP